MAIKKHSLELAQRHTDRDLSMLTDSGVVNCLVSTITELKRERFKTKEYLTRFQELCNYWTINSNIDYSDISQEIENHLNQ